MKQRVLFSLIAFVATLGWVNIAFAADKVAKATNNWGVGLGAGLPIALAALGGALGQGRAAAAFLEGVSRNPKARGEVFLALILGLAFIETLVIFSFVIANGLVGKL